MHKNDLELNIKAIVINICTISIRNSVHLKRVPTDFDNFVHQVTKMCNESSISNLKQDQESLPQDRNDQY